MGYVKWLGHAAFEIFLDGRTILIDPWITGNPKAACKIEEIKRADLILVTHDHGDHLGDAVKIARKTGAAFAGIYELANYMNNQGVRKAYGMNIGGSIKIKDIEVILVPAFHSAERGREVGYVIRGKEATIYHAGDTGLFYDIKLYADLYPVDIALVPIGGLYTMDPLQAAEFITLIKPKVAIPMHYGTFPPIDKDPKDFQKAVEDKGIGTKVVILKPGEKYEF
ncbi:MAG: metal-dependent hydrolase [Thermoprotei archaeon]|nr:MAG: metal-dependent hydrolase [Thermoprotei archaeon]RLF00973.1 MAG: metal-dependent hydrolase [Thermoprotei archaeon]